MIPAMIKNQLPIKQLSFKPTGIIMGKTGAGKTTLCNKLCGTNHQAGSAKGSVTQQLFQNDVNQGYYPFALIDTPGTDSSQESYKHAFLLKAGLTATKVNTIFFIIKYDSRIDKLTDNYFQLEAMVGKYASKIVVLISQWDQSKNPQKEFKDICQIFNEESPKLANLICISEQCSASDISNLMYSCLSNMPAEHIVITDEEFHLNFSIYQMKNKVKVSFEQYKRLAKQKEQEFTELINALNQDSGQEKDEILHMCIVTFRQEVEQLLDEFRQKHATTMDELDWYSCYIQMQKENIEICNNFAENVGRLMSYNLLDNTDPRNLIKKCPRCELIWYKTEGCDGPTTCGNNGFSNYFDLSRRPFFQYVLHRVNGKLQWRRNEKGKREPVKPNNVNNNRVGCGASFVWGSLPKLEDEKILELYKVKTIEEARDIIRNARYQTLRTNYTQGIDQSFHR